MDGKCSSTINNLDNNYCSENVKNVSQKICHKNGNECCIAEDCKSSEHKVLDTTSFTCKCETGYYQSETECKICNGEGFSIQDDGKCLRDCKKNDVTSKNCGNSFSGKINKETCGTDDCKCNNCKQNYYLNNNQCINCENGYTSPENNTGGMNSCKKTCNNTITNCSSYEKDQIEQGSNETCTCTACITGYYIKTDNNKTTCEPKTIKFTFNNDGGTGGQTQDKEIKYTDKDKENQNKISQPNKTGYTFKGYCDKNDVNKCYFGEDGAFNTSITITWTENITTIELKAKWERTSCEKGKYLENANCTDCPGDSYCDGKIKNTCPPNYTANASTGKETSSECQIQCSANTYVKDANGACVPCEATQTSGQHNVNYGNKSTCEQVKCPEGEFVKDHGCMPCPKGQTTTENNTSTRCTPISVTCKAGKYLPKGETSCSPCPEGSYCDTNTNYNYNENKDQGRTLCSTLGDEYKQSDGERKSNKDCYKTTKFDEIIEDNCKNNKTTIQHYNSTDNIITYDNSNCEAGCLLKEDKNTYEGQKCTPCAKNHWCNGGESTTDNTKYTNIQMKEHCKSKINKDVWVDGSGCKCPVGMSTSIAGSKTIKDCKYTKDTKFCFGDPSQTSPKCFTISDLDATYDPSWKVVY